jgi:hypothetical protein
MMTDIETNIVRLLPHADATTSDGLWVHGLTFGELLARTGLSPGPVGAALRALHERGAVLRRVREGRKEWLATGARV